MRRRSLLCALPTPFLGKATHAQARTLHLACYTNQTRGGQGAHLFAEKVTELSGGTLKITVEILPPLLPFPMITTTSALASFYAPLFSDLEPVFGLSTLPMLAATFEEAEALDRIARQYYSAALARHSQVLLATEPWRPAALWSTFRLHSGADLNGASFSLGHTSYSGRGQLWEQPFIRLGVRRVSPFEAEVLLTNGYLANLVFTQQFSSFTEIFLAVQLNFLTVSRMVFGSLSEPQRQVLVAAGRATETALWKRAREFVLHDQQEIAGRGVSVAAPPPDNLMKVLRESAEPAIQRWAESVGGISMLADYHQSIGRT